MANPFTRSFTTDLVLRVWDDDAQMGTGDRIEIGPDDDGLDMVRLTYIDRNDKKSEFPDLLPGHAEKLHAALGKYLALQKSINTDD